MGRVKTKDHTAKSILLLEMLLLVGILLIPVTTLAGKLLCAQVKIEIKQELTLERQAFDAHMRINNGLSHISLEDVKVVVTFADENGDPVRSSADPNASQEDNDFFVRQDSEGMSLDADNNTWNINSIPPSSTRDIHWLIIPVPGDLTTDTLYYVGATLTYTIGGEAHETKVTPDYIYVKPLPQLQLDYFLPQYVYGDDPETEDTVEPVEPFNLGVRVKNKGYGTAHQLKIDSAQPEIVENKMGLLIDFLITGSEVNGDPATDSLLVDFGDIEPQRSGMARWIMECTLSGEFVEFKAYFSHSDELGGELTSLIKQEDLNTHVLIHDVLVDLPGRDNIRDFLSKRDVNSSVIRVFESDSEDHEVSTQGGTLTSAGTNKYTLTLTEPVFPGFVFVKIENPPVTGKIIKEAIRSDGKTIKLDNIWISRTRNPDMALLNLFDVDSTGTYTVWLDDVGNLPAPPTLQTIVDKSVSETQQVSFIVEASDPNGTTPALSAAPLPAGASFVDQGNGMGIFDWTPSVGQAGTYKIVFSATDGALTDTEPATIKVYKESDTDHDGMDDDWERANFEESLAQNGYGDEDGDGISNLDEYLNGSDPNKPDHAPTVPVINLPVDQGEVDTQIVDLVIENSTDEDGDTITYEFEIYSDQGLTDLVDFVTDATEGVTVTAWTVTEILLDHQHYYWRVRAHDGYSYSIWNYGSFFVNTANEPPGGFFISYPAPGTQANTLRPMLEVTNAKDPDEDDVIYTFEIYADDTLSSLVVSSPDVVEGTGGSTSWQVDLDLTDTATYYWKAIATDEHSAQTETTAGSFTVNTSQPAPTVPVIVSPIEGSEVRHLDLDLVVANAQGQGSLLYYFEIDTVQTFDSPDKMISGGIDEGIDTTAWNVTGLTDNTTYYWRAKADDGGMQSAWVIGSFFINADNEVPSVPIILNPGNHSWPDTLAPIFEISASIDPDQDQISYEFELFSDPDMVDLVASGQTTYLQWSTPEALMNNTRYYWQVRAIDEHGLSSGWTQPHEFFTRSLSDNEAPRITLLSPGQDMITNATHIIIGWVDTDPDTNADISLYYDTDNSGVDGERIVIGLREDPEDIGDTYEWDTEGIEGTYYIYGTINDNMYSATSYAPGRVTLDYTVPTGSVLPVGATYPDTQIIAISASEQSRIYYTLNGDEPTLDSDEYSAPIEIVQSTILKYMVVDTAGNQSPTYTETYVIGTAHPPQANGDAYTVAEDTLLSVSTPGVLANDTDEDSDPLTAVLDTDVSHGTLVLNTDGSFTYRPQQDYFGSDAFTYHAHDGGLESNIATVTFTVEPVIDRPTLTDIGDQTINEDSSTLAIGFTIHDVDTPTTDLTVTAASSDQALVPDTNIVLGGSGANRTITVSPATDRSGTATITVTVQDTDGENAVDTFELYVIPVDDEPTINVTEPAADVLTGANTISIQWDDADPDSNANISLYYDTDNMGTDGTLIVSGIQEDPDAGQDSYAWDISALEGSYYIYAIIQDEALTGSSYAPGRVTIDRTPPEVTATPSGGIYTSVLNIVLTVNENATIYFTTDGSDPTDQSAVYSIPVEIDVLTTLKAMAVDQVGLHGNIISETYIMDLDADGMADHWEMEYFGTLDRDGTQDYDGDGLSDLDEYLFGSNPVVSNAPTLPLVISPEDQTEVTELMPSLVIENSVDPDQDEITYIFEIYSDQEMTELVVDASGVLEIPNQTTWTVQEELNDNTWYYWRVRATDGKGFSSWVYASFFVNTVNDPPGEFFISSPANGSETDVLTPQLQITNSTDVDGDTITYVFEVYEDEAMTISAAFSPIITQGIGGTTSWTVDLPLNDNDWYFWRVFATDEHGLATSSASASFFVNTVNDAPQAPSISEPADTGEVGQVNPMLIVANAMDVDEDSLTYEFQIDRVNTFDSPSKQVSGSIPETQNFTGWQPNNLDDNTTYYWRVRADDGYAQSSWVEASFFVNTLNDPPEMPTLKNPGDESWVDTLTPMLELHRSSDLDNDTLTYRFEVYADADMSSLVVQGVSNSPDWVVSPALNDNTFYFWRAQAEDEHGAVSEWMDLASFFTDSNGVNDPPMITVLEPADDLLTNSDSVVIRWEDSDPDNNAQISLHYSTTPDMQNSTLISANINEDPDGSEDMYTWDISQLEDGTYYIYAEITDHVNSESSICPGILIIDWTAPTDPMASPQGGTYTEAQNVSLTVGEDADIHYTMDGSEPDAGSALYSSPIDITQGTTTLKFVAKDAAGNLSNIVTEEYIILVVAGDLNGDGVVNHEDQNMFWNAFGTCDGDDGFIPEADYNDTGCVDFMDFIIWLRHYIDYIRNQYCIISENGDLDGDGDVDRRDRRIIRRARGTCAGDPGFVSEADLNEDGCITNQDLRKWRDYQNAYRICRMLSR